MLLEHLSQEHDAASRRSPVIDSHIKAIHSQILQGKPANILDLGCGPGLYAVCLARLGHRVVGIDISPASVRYAREQSEKERLQCRFVLGDMRDTDYGGPFDLVIQIFGELNTFKPDDVGRILARCNDSLVKGGHILLEIDLPQFIRSIGERANTWKSVDSGLFLDHPHIYMTESFWDEDSQTSTTRFITIDSASDEVTVHAATQKAYSEDECRQMLATAGFSQIETWPALSCTPEYYDPDRYVLTGVK